MPEFLLLPALLVPLHSCFAPFAFRLSHPR
jgi:hypothetical protein